jgi:hypothetical protein
MLRLATSLGKTPEFIFVQKSGVPDKLKDHWCCRPTERSQQSVKRLSRTSASQFSIQQTSIPICQLTIDLPAAISILPDPNERTVGLEKQPWQLLQTLGCLLETDLHGDRSQ